MKRLYSLFERQYGQKRWTRLSPNAYYKEQAIRIYQTQLINGSLSGREMALRVVDGLIHINPPNIS